MDILLLITTIVFLILFLVYEKKFKSIKYRYAPVINIDKAVESRQKTLSDIEAEVSKAEAKKQKSEALIAELNKQISEIKGIITVFESQLDIIECGIYTPVYDFSASDNYKLQQGLIIDKQKAMVQNNEAATCDTSWTINGSLSEGQRVVKQYQKLILRAFNGECGSLISKVKWNNFEQVKERIKKLFDTINRLGKSFSIQINNDYLDLKLEELTLEHEYNLKRQQEREKQRAAQEQKREEERVKREYDRLREKAEEEENMYQQALEKAKEDAEKATGDKLEKLNEKVRKLELELQAAQERKERAISMAQQTKRGHVYVISNIGSFGENVYKIGMTRRLEPVDRVKELGDASVPFTFDIHAMIFSEDAPKLETALHSKFDTRRVNLVNQRKEFFNVSLSEIKDIIKDNQIEADFIEVPEAEEYRETCAILKRMKEQQLSQN